VNDALAKEDLDAAAKALQAALEKFPADPNLRRLHIRLYSAFLTAEKPQAAADQLADYVGHQVEQSLSTNRPDLLAGLDPYLERMVQAYIQGQKGDVALEKLAQWRKRAEAANVDSSAFLRSAATCLVLLDRAAEAIQLVDAAVEESAKAHQANTEDPQATQRWLEALRLRRDVLRRSGATNAEKAQQEFAEAIRQAISQPNPSPAAITLYVNDELTSIVALMSQNPEEATSKLNALRSLINGQSNGQMPQQLRAQVLQTLDNIERRLKSDLERNRLVGQKAPALGKATWLNGTPLTDDDLNGKVVLLDFWAVWCGPCIATFPHLRQWHDKYADRGLVMIGVTQRYKFGWDEVAKRPKRDESLSAEQEDRATEKFLAHHQLRHRIAVLPDDAPVYQQYGVTGIPQVVLIDKKGLVRMIRVGSGEQNARDLEKMIEQLLAE